LLLRMRLSPRRSYFLRGVRVVLQLRSSGVDSSFDASDANFSVGFILFASTGKHALNAFFCKLAVTDQSTGELLMSVELRAELCAGDGVKDFHDVWFAECFVDPVSIT